MTLVLSKSEKATIFRLRLEGILDQRKQRGAPSRDVVIAAAASVFAAFDAEPTLTQVPTGDLVAELRRRKAAAEAEAAP